MWRPILAIALFAVALVAAFGMGCGKSDTSPAGSPTGAHPPVASNSGPGSTPNSSAGMTPNSGSGSALNPPVPPKSVIPDPPKPDQPGQKNWSATQVKALDVAKKTAAAIAGMRNTYGESVTHMTTPEGNATVMLYYKIQDAKNFRVDFVIPKSIPARGAVLADGRGKRALGEKKMGPSMPLSFASEESKLSDAQVVRRWPLEFSRLMFTGFTDSKDSFVRMIRALARGEGGFKLTFEERTMPLRGSTVRNYRFYAVRSREAMKKYGPCEFEVVVDGTRFLPVTVRVDSKDASGKPWKQQWSGGWRFNQKFKPGEVTSLG